MSLEGGVRCAPSWGLGCKCVASVAMATGVAGGVRHFLALGPGAPAPVSTGPQQLQWELSHEAALSCLCLPLLLLRWQLWPGRGQLGGWRTIGVVAWFGALRHCIQR